MQAIGKLISVVGYITFVITGMWGFLLCVGIITDAVGFWGTVASFFLLPVTFVAAPWYAGFALGDWFPLMLNYGGGIGSIILCAIGAAMGGSGD